MQKHFTITRDPVSDTERIFLVETYYFTFPNKNRGRIFLIGNPSTPSLDQPAYYPVIIQPTRNVPCHNVLLAYIGSLGFGSHRWEVLPGCIIPWRSVRGYVSCAERISVV